MSVDNDWLTRDAAPWEEGKHKRGQPKNKGQFGPGGGGASSPKVQARAKTPLTKVDPTKQTAAAEAAMETSITYSKVRMALMAKRDKMMNLRYAAEQVTAYVKRGISPYRGINLEVKDTYITQKQFDDMVARVGDAGKDAGVPVKVYPGHSFVIIPAENGRVTHIKPMGGFTGGDDWESCNIQLFADEMLTDEMVNGNDPVATVHHEMQHARFQWATEFSPNHKKVREFIAKNLDALAKEDGNHPNAADCWEVMRTNSSRPMAVQALAIVAVNESLSYDFNPMEPDAARMTEKSHPTYMKLRALIDQEWASQGKGRLWTPEDKAKAVAALPGKPGA